MPTDVHTYSTRHFRYDLEDKNVFTLEEAVSTRLFNDSSPHQLNVPRRRSTSWNTKEYILTAFKRTVDCRQKFQKRVPINCSSTIIKTSIFSFSLILVDCLFFLFFSRTDRKLSFNDVNPDKVKEKILTLSYIFERVAIQSIFYTFTVHWWDGSLGSGITCHI
jgi:hypothetical protein